MNKRFVFFLLDIAAPAAAAWKTTNLNLRYSFSFSEFRVQSKNQYSTSCNCDWYSLLDSYELVLFSITYQIRSSYRVF
ncbi:hypothetical protein L1887_22454 [Cichorium endivia]|nr:hypothetical protein L1887_22454 [Cichorium endivia]